MPQGEDGTHADRKKQTKPQSQGFCLHQPVPGQGLSPAAIPGAAQ